MPELPEVETVCRQLREREPVLVGRSIIRADVRWKRTIAVPNAERFEADIVGLRVREVTRHGKNIIIHLERGPARKYLLVHLRMSGRLDVLATGEANSKHARVIFPLSDLTSGAAHALRFDDARKFGRIWLVDDVAQVIGDLGPDALTVNEQHFTQTLSEKKGALKPILLNQSFVAGIGNIYADESLFRAKLHPQRAASSLTPKQAALLHQCVIEVLREGIHANGASFDWVYPQGNFQENFRVYGQTDKPCVNCSTPIQRILVGQRSTHFCPQCQRA